MVFSTDSSSALSGYSGSCKAFFDFQLSSVHLPETAEAAEGFLGASGEWTAEMERWDFGLVGLVGRKEKEEGRCGEDKG